MKGEKKHLFRSFSTLVAIAAGAIAIYTFLFPKKHELAVVVLNETDIFTTTSELEDLTVTYKGEDLQKLQSSLKSYGFRVVNIGDSDIPINYFDPLFPVNICISNGELIDSVSVTAAKTEYLADVANLRLSDSNCVSMDPMLFDSKSFLDFRFYALVSKGRTASPYLQGKVLGQNSLEIISSDYYGKNISTGWDKLKSLWGILIYFVPGLTFVVGILIFISYLKKEYVKWFRRKNLKEVASKLGVDMPVALGKSFMRYGCHIFKKYESLSKADAIVKYNIENLLEDKASIDRAISGPVRKVVWSIPFVDQYITIQAVRDSIVVLHDGHYEFNKELLPIIEQLARIEDPIETRYS